MDKKLLNKYLTELMAVIPDKDSKISAKRKDMELLRAAIVAEYDAVSLYEQLSEATTNPKLKTLFLDIANEEKVHIGEFQKLLETIDPEHEEKVKEGEDEVDEILGDK